MIILNKVDLVSQDESDPMVSDILEDLEKELRNINSLAKIIHSVRCQVDLCNILDYRAYDAKVSYLISIYHPGPIIFLWNGVSIAYFLFHFFLAACGSSGRIVEREPIC